MGFDIELVELGSSVLDESTNLTKVQAALVLTGENDLEHFGEVDDYSCLGVTSMPFPANDEGSAEGLIGRNVGGADGVLMGARDERCAQVYGDLKPGDTVLHACDPGASAQVICKGERRQVINITKDSEGNNMVHVLDGTNDKIQITAFGSMIEISRTGTTIVDSSGGKTCSIIMKNGVISLIGTVVLGGVKPLSQLLFAAAPGVPVVGGVGGTGTPAPGVFFGV